MWWLVCRVKSDIWVSVMFFSLIYELGQDIWLLIFLQEDANSLGYGKSKWSLLRYHALNIIGVQ